MPSQSVDKQLSANRNHDINSPAIFNLPSLSAAPSIRSAAASTSGAPCAAFVAALPRHRRRRAITGTAAPSPPQPRRHRRRPAGQPGAVKLVPAANGSWLGDCHFLPRLPTESQQRPTFSGGSRNQCRSFRGADNVILPSLSFGYIIEYFLSQRRFVRR